MSSRKAATAILNSKGTGAPRGFTLIELLVVIAIIGILASIILASLGSAREKSRDARRISDVKQIHNALELYASDNKGQFPSSGNVDVCLGLTSAQTCWGGAHGNDTVNAALAPYIPSISQDPIPGRIYGSYVYRSTVLSGCPSDNPGGGPYVSYCGTYLIAWKPHDKDSQYPTLQECNDKGAQYAAFEGNGGAPHCATGGTCRQCGIIVQ